MYSFLVIFQSVMKVFFSCSYMVSLDCNRYFVVVVNWQHGRFQETGLLPLCLYLSFMFFLRRLKL